MNKFYRLADIHRQWFRTPYFGFVQGHAYWAPHDIGQIRSHIAKPAKEIVGEFEEGANCAAMVNFRSSFPHVYNSFSFRAF